MSNIYELTQDFLTIQEMMEDPELDPQTLTDTMEAVEGELEIKAESYAKIMKNLEGDIEALENEIRRLTSRKKAIEENIKRMKAALQGMMEVTGKTKFKTDLFSFGIQKNTPSVVIDVEDVYDIPEDYLKYKAPEINKTAIREAIQQGENLEGIAHLETKNSLRIR